MLYYFIHVLCFKGPGCKFNDRLKRMPATQDYVKKQGLTEAWDIEDFVGLSKNIKVARGFGNRGWSRQVAC